MATQLLNEVLKTELLSHAPRFAEMYKARVEAANERLVKQFGETYRGAANDFTFYQDYKLVSNFLVWEGNKINSPRHLDRKILASAAKKVGELTVTAWIEKISGKMGELDNPTVARVDGFRYNIRGTKNGHDVQIVQDIILNISKHGLHFNQFPSRIYLDGKSLSETKYKAMMRKEVM